MTFFLGNCTFNHHLYTRDDDARLATETCTRINSLLSELTGEPAEWFCLKSSLPWRGEKGHTKTRSLAAPAVLTPWFFNRHPPCVPLIDWSIASLKSPL
jgi:hypothetical protein